MFYSLEIKHVVLRRNLKHTQNTQAHAPKRRSKQLMMPRRHDYSLEAFINIREARGQSSDSRQSYTRYYIHLC